MTYGTVIERGRAARQTEDGKWIVESIDRDGVNTLPLGADLFQGYFLSRPGAVPSAIAAPAQEILREFPNGAEEHR